MATALSTLPSHPVRLFPRILFVLDGTGHAGVTTRINALHTAAKDPTLTLFLHTVPVLAAALAELHTNGPSEPVWHPVQDPDHTVPWSWSPHP